MKRIPQLCILVGLAMLLSSCGGNSRLDDTEAAVVLTVELEEYNPDIDICDGSGFDVAISKMNVFSNAKEPGGVLGSNQDVNITRWVVTPVRTDGGSTASPEWVIDQGVLVPAGGDVVLENWRVYPAEYFEILPLSNLLPQNGGFDPETGNTNIRQSLWLEMFGRTVSGKAVSTEAIPIAFNFFCNQ
jgi:hypothetical protein